MAPKTKAVVKSAFAAKHANGTFAKEGRCKWCGITREDPNPLMDPRSEKQKAEGVVLYSETAEFRHVDGYECSLCPRAITRQVNKAQYLKEVQSDGKAKRSHMRNKRAYVRFRNKGGGKGRSNRTIGDPSDYRSPDTSEDEEETAQAVEEAQLNPYEALSRSGIMLNSKEPLGVHWRLDIFEETMQRKALPHEMCEWPNRFGQMIEGVFRDSKFGCPDGCIAVEACAYDIGEKVKKVASNTNDRRGSSVEVDAAYSKLRKRLGVSFVDVKPGPDEEGGDHKAVKVAAVAKVKPGNESVSDGVDFLTFPFFQQGRMKAAPKVASVKGAQKQPRALGRDQQPAMVPTDKRMTELVEAKKCLQSIEMQTQLLQDPQGYVTVTDQTMSDMLKNLDKRLSEKHAHLYQQQGTVASSSNGDGDQIDQWDGQQLRAQFASKKPMCERVVPFVKSVHAKKLPEAAASYLWHAFLDVTSVGLKLPDCVIGKVLGREIKVLVEGCRKSGDYSDITRFVSLSPMPEGVARVGAIALSMAGVPEGLRLSYQKELIWDALLELWRPTLEPGCLSGSHRHAGFLFASSVVQAGIQDEQCKDSCQLSFYLLVFVVTLMYHAGVGGKPEGDMQRSIGFVLHSTL